MKDITHTNIAAIHGLSDQDLAELGQRWAVLVLDTSSSMEQYHKIEQAKSGAKGFADDMIQQGASVSLVTFDYAAEQLVPLTTDLAKLDKAIDKLRANGSTDMAAGIALAAEALAGKAGERDLYIVTDGMPNDEQDALREAEAAKSAGITVSALGVDNANLRLLRELASDPSQPEIIQDAKLLGTAIRALARRSDTKGDEEL